MQMKVCTAALLLIVNITLLTKVRIVKAMVFPVTLQLWKLDGKKDGAPKNGCLRSVVLEKTPESPLDSKEIKPVIPKWNQTWILIGRTDAEAEAPVFWSSDANSWFTEKVPDAGKDWGQKEKRASEDEMAGWHHRCNEHELGKLQEMVWDRLACCSPWGRKELGMTKQLINNNNCC